MAIVVTIDGIDTLAYDTGNQETVSGLITSIFSDNKLRTSVKEKIEGLFDGLGSINVDAIQEKIEERILANIDEATKKDKRTKTFDSKLDDFIKRFEKNFGVNFKKIEPKIDNLFKKIATDTNATFTKLSPKILGAFTKLTDGMSKKIKDTSLVTNVKDDVKKKETAIDKIKIDNMKPVIMEQLDILSKKETKEPEEKHEPSRPVLPPVVLDQHASGNAPKDSTSSTPDNKEDLLGKAQTKVMLMGVSPEAIKDLQKIKTGEETKQTEPSKPESGGLLSKLMGMLNGLSFAAIVAYVLGEFVSTLKVPAIGPIIAKLFTKLDYAKVFLRVLTSPFEKLFAKFGDSLKFLTKSADVADATTDIAKGAEAGGSIFKVFKSKFFGFLANTPIGKLFVAMKGGVKAGSKLFKFVPFIGDLLSLYLGYKRIKEGSGWLDMTQGIIDIVSGIAGLTGIGAPVSILLDSINLLIDLTRYGAKKDAEMKAAGGIGILDTLKNKLKEWTTKIFKGFYNFLPKTLRDYFFDIDGDNIKFNSLKALNSLFNPIQSLMLLSEAVLPEDKKGENVIDRMKSALKVKSKQLATNLIGLSPMLQMMFTVDEEGNIVFNGADAIINKLSEKLGITTGTTDKIKDGWKSTKNATNEALASVDKKMQDAWDVMTGNDWETSYGVAPRLNEQPIQDGVIDTKQYNRKQTMIIPSKQDEQYSFGSENIYAKQDGGLIKVFNKMTDVLKTQLEEARTLKKELGDRIEDVSIILKDTYKFMPNLIPAPASGKGEESMLTGETRDPIDEYRKRMRHTNDY